MADPFAAARARARARSWGAVEAFNYSAAHESAQLAQRVADQRARNEPRDARPVAARAGSRALVTAATAYAGWPIPSDYPWWFAIGVSNRASTIARGDAAAVAAVFFGLDSASEQRATLSAVQEQELAPS